mgnify:CR=1 FL=1
MKDTNGKMVVGEEEMMEVSEVIMRNFRMKSFHGIRRLYLQLMQLEVRVRSSRLQRCKLQLRR